MRTNNIVILILLLFSQITFGQTGSEKLIHGKIRVESGNVEGVTIINLVNEKNTSSDSNGDFFILAKADDLLVFSSVNLEYFRRIIEENDLKTDVLIIKMTSKTTELKEVIVNNHPEINAVSLGISPKGVKHYTPAERKLATASSMKMNPMGFDPLINLISGRTAMLKKELEVEKEERLLAKIGTLFDDDYYIKMLKIPANYIKGFQYYCIEDRKFAEVLKSKNKTMTEFLIVPLAEKYNKIISDEN
ncbi:peptidase associated/transthyretin-like domain-containing protein [Flavobacterium soyangense]|uniref:Carboxypeptidase-like regulatory domain-containing protein n=1 Tax=Flavobacterium soyangense TaxID=2023265 RepID=A0A930UDD7_9FLAO|nr:hypothetical protein [Flavobacterium soyangense]MBF2710015.1 hypothetical protein [Flavobacterium soyangense]